MSIMQNKMSRRIALGTIAGGLAGGIVLLRSLREPKPDGAGPRGKEVDPYGKIDISPKEIASELSPDDVEKAFALLQKERDMWLNFRGIAGRIKIVSETTYADRRTPKIAADEGYISLKFDLQPVPGMRSKMVLPANIRMAYSASEGGAAVWSFAAARRGAENPGDFTGTEIESIKHDDLYQFLALPPSLLTLVNGGIKEIVSGWKVVRNTKAAQPDSYVFESNGRPASGRMLPTLALSGGHLSEFIPKRKADESYPIISFRDHFLKSGIAYPRAISLASGGAGAKVEQENTAIAITLAELKIATA